MSHKSEDYKISAVNYYNKNDVSMDEVCNIFNCSKTSLKRWIDRYSENNNIVRENRDPISYKITKDQVDYALKLLKDNEQIIISESSERYEIIKKYLIEIEMKIIKEEYNETKRWFYINAIKQ